MSDQFQGFRQNLLEGGMHYTLDQARFLFEVGKYCMLKGGVPLAGGLAALGAGAATVTIPGIGVVPGWAAGALAGMVLGTLSCTAVLTSGGIRLRNKFDELLRRTRLLPTTGEASP